MDEKPDYLLPLSILEVMYLDSALASKIEQGEAVINEGFDIRADVDNFIELRQKVRQLIGLGESNETST